MTLQEDAWKQRVSSQKENSEKAIVTDIAIQVMKYCQPSMDKDKIAKSVHTYIDYMQRECPYLNDKMLDNVLEYLMKCYSLHYRTQRFEDSETSVRVFATIVAQSLTKEDFATSYIDPEQREEVIDELFENDLQHLLIFEIAQSTFKFGTALCNAHNDGRDYRLSMEKEKYKEQVKKMLELQEEAWNKRITPIDEANENLLVTDLIQKTLNISHPWIPKTEIPIVAQKYICYLRKNNKIPKGKLFDLARYHVRTHFEARRSDYP